MRKIPLSQGLFASVDDEDFVRVLSASWHALRVNRNWYARSAEGVYLHRFVVDAPPGFEVDHEDGDGLNNQKRNLRVVTHQQNLANQRLSHANTSGFKGVSKTRSRRRPWAAQTKYRGKRLHLGTFRTPEEAARAYDEKMIELHGDYAMTNQKLGLLTWTA